MIAVVELHVVPHEADGTWTVDVDGLGPALSSHDTADEAQVAARRAAQARGADRLYLHDRYQRVRAVNVGGPRR
jgi:hypothetical protein